MELALVTAILLCCLLLAVYGLIDIATVCRQYNAARIAREQTLLCSIPTQLRQMRLLPATEKARP